MAVEKSYEVNPLAELFPAMPAAELQELADSIETDGLQEPSQLDAEGRILDGRSRYEACKLAMRLKAFKARRWTGPASPEHYARFVLQRNILRRNLTASQRAQLTVKLTESAKVGQPKRKPRDPKIGTGASARAEVPDTGCPITASEQAKLAGTSPGAIKQARRVQAKGPATEQAVIDGTKTVREVLAEPVAEPEPLIDPFGNTVPDRSICSWNAAARELQEAATQLHTIRRRAVGNCEKNAVGWGHVVAHSKQLDAHLRNAVAVFRFGKPYCVCCWCGGDGCKVCIRLGWLPKEVYQRAPKEQKWKNG